MRLSIELLALFAGTGCLGVQPNASLADLPNVELHVRTYPAPDDDDADAQRPSEATLFLDYDEYAFDDQHPGDCATLDASALRGAFNDERLRLVEAGHTDDEFGLCVEPRLEGVIDLDIAGGGRIDVSDRSLAVTAALDVGMMPGRLATLRSHPAWRFASGEMIGFTWSHPEELDGQPPSFVLLTFRRPDSTGFTIASTAVANGEIRFELPSPIPTTGSGEITIKVGQDAAAHLGGSTATCVGADSCSWSGVRWYVHLATFE